MAAKDFVVTRSLLLDADVSRVWEVLTSPMLTKQYMFNCEVCSDWLIGRTIEWRGEYQGQEIYQKGEILELIPRQVLKYTTFDPYSGAEDIPENYIHVTYKLVAVNDKTELLTTLSNFGGDDVRAEYAAQAWDFEVLPKLKVLAETHDYAGLNEMNT